MSWRDRDFDDDARGRMGRPGGDWQGVRPTFDNPMTWSVPMARLLGIAVRVHVVFLIYIIIRMAQSLPSVAPDAGDRQPLGFALTALRLGCLFGIVLLHEFGHCLACRSTGGEADEILMWPLGGLAFCRPGHGWRSHLATAVGGPMVNVIIFLILAPVLGIITGSWFGVALPNPLLIDLGQVLVDGRQPWWLLAMFFIHVTNLVLLLFNLLPIFPLDGGRICQSLLWPRFGYARSMRLAVYAGYIGAIGLGVFGAVMHQWMLVGIAFFGGFTCWWTLKQLQFTESFMGVEDDQYAASLWGGGDDDRPEEDGTDRARKKAARQAELEASEAEEIDRILAKIASEGMGGVTLKERKLLKRVTRKARRG